MTAHSLLSGYRHRSDFLLVKSATKVILKRSATECHGYIIFAFIAVWRVAVGEKMEFRQPT